MTVLQVDFEKDPLSLGGQSPLTLASISSRLPEGAFVENVPPRSGNPSGTGKGLSMASKPYDYTFDFGFENLDDEEEIEDEISSGDHSNPGEDDGGEEIADSVSLKPVSTCAPKKPEED